MTTSTVPRSVSREVWVATRLTAALLLIAGVAYPALLWVTATIAFSDRADGSLVADDSGRVVGSAMIGQAFTRPEYFHGRPSATAYDAGASSGSNIGPTNPQLLSGNGSSYAGVTAYASTYRRDNNLSSEQTLPSDAVTASGSGLDPHISPENADLQVARVVAIRAPRLSRAMVMALVRANTEGRTLGMLGDPRVNVLALNLALDSASAAARVSP